MGLELSASDDELKIKFNKLSTPRDVADLLEVKYSDLTYLIYRRKFSDNYKSFQLKKRSGGYRKILAPVSSLKIIQRKLNHILQLIYEPKPSVHGFTVGQNIVTNAKTHLRKSFVFNIDLKDFFPSINFGRVRGMFMGKPYHIPADAATVLSQICCFENQLPQGAPTSPIVSNMLCAQLDSQLQWLATTNHSIYTRYADDITFSTNLRTFPKALAKKDMVETKIEVSVGKDLERIVEKNGFQINDDKVRLQIPSKRQEVTGIKVNDKPNVNRKFIRKIRAMLHAWEKHGLESAEKEFQTRYFRKQIHPDREPPKYTKALKGRINYLKMVRGEKDPIYRKFANKYLVLSGKDPKYFENPLDEISAALWVLECEDDDKFSQGTAFMLEGYGLVTCDHVFVDGIKAFSHDNPSKKYDAKIIKHSGDLDVAILEIDCGTRNNLKIGDSGRLEIRDLLTVAGFPNYRIGDTPSITDGRVRSFRTISTIRWMLLDAPIISGNSGGPVMNRDNRVVGIAATGGDSVEEAKKTEHNGVIPISVLDLI